MELSHKLITRNEHMERGVLVIANLLFRPNLSKSCTILDISPVWQRLETGNEPGNLLLPIVQGGRGRHDEERTPDVMRLSKIGEQ